MRLVTVFINILIGMSTTIIKSVRGSWEVQDTRSSIQYGRILEGSRVRQPYAYTYIHDRESYSTQPYAVRIRLQRTEKASCSVDF